MATAEHAIPELSTLEPEWRSSSRRRGTLHAFVVDHVPMNRSTACWIDSDGYARTDPLVEISPSRRILDRRRR